MKISLFACEKCVLATTIQTKMHHEFEPRHCVCVCHTQKLTVPVLGSLTAASPAVISRAASAAVGHARPDLDGGPSSTAGYGAQGWGKASNLLLHAQIVAPLSSPLHAWCLAQLTSPARNTPTNPLGHRGTGRRIRPRRFQLAPRLRSNMWSLIHWPICRMRN